MPKIRVLIADGHAVAAEGLQALLRDIFDLVGVAHDGPALLESVERLRPDVVVVDISMPLLNGIDAIRQVRARSPHTRVVVLTMHRETQLAADAFRAGALGYLLKTSPGEELIAAIQQARQGRAFVTSLLAKDLITLLIESGSAPAAAAAALTPRQREVLQLIAEGRTLKEVAGILHISPRTAESHKYEMMQNLGVKTTAELIHYAIRAKMAAG